MSFAAAVLKARVAVRALTTPTKPNPYVGGLGVATSPVLHSAAAGPAPPANSINKADLIKTVAEEHKLSQAQSKRIIDTVIGTISESLAEKKTIKISGLGSFSTYESAARMGRVPSTQERVQIPAKTRIRFRANKGLKEAVQLKK